MEKKQKEHEKQLADFKKERDRENEESTRREKELLRKI